MVKTRRVLAAVLLLALAVLAWLWFTRPRRVDMTAYVPADAILYAEADSLPEILDAFTSTDAWRELAPAAGVDANYGRAGRLSGFLSFTGAGPSDAVVLSRAQVAVAVLGFQAAEESDTTLNFSPREALVAETHTSEWRVKSAVEKLVGDFARRKFGAQTFERREVDGVVFLTWAEPSGGRHRIVAAVEDSVAVVGNDEAAVRACLDVRRGARPSLAGDEQLKEMRARVGGEDALAFGYAPRGSAAKAAEVFAPAFVGDVSSEPQVQSVLATLLPQFINRTLGALGWSSRVVGRSVEDTYFLALAGGMSQRLQGPLAPAGRAGEGAAAVLPPDAYQVTFYDFRNPEEAWKGLNAALASQVDVTSAALVSRALDALLKPYGVAKPRDFLRACGSELATARLDAASEGKVLIASVRERAALREQVLAHLGRGSHVERAGEVEIIISNDAEEGAAAFAGDQLLLGTEDDVRRCVRAFLEGRTLRDSPALKDAAQQFFDSPAFTLTLTDDRESARAVLSNFGGRSATPALEDALARRGRSVSQTRLAEGGFEKKTRSAFGLFGEVFSRAAPR